VATVPDPFISADDLTDYLGRDVTNDDGAIIALDAACDMVRTFAERQFNAATETYTGDGTGSDAFLLPNLPVTAAGTVTVNGTAETEYELNNNGILFRGTAGCDPRLAWPAGRQNISVTYEHGYASSDLPRDVRMVALQAAARILVQGVAVEETVGQVRVKYAGAALDLTEGERRILRKYRPIR
jgi:hypothetical protein